MHHAPSPGARGVPRRGDEDHHPAPPENRPRRRFPARRLHHQMAREMARGSAVALGANFHRARALHAHEAAMAYQASDNPDRIKAFAAVLVVHAALGAVILSGLSVRSVETTIERLRTFDI